MRGASDHEICLAALELFQVDGEGLDKLDRDILQDDRREVRRRAGRPGDARPSRSARRPTRSQDVYEPYLIMRGFLMRTPRGRVVTKSGFRHCGAEPPAGPDDSSSSDRPVAVSGHWPRV